MGVYLLTSVALVARLSYKTPMRHLIIPALLATVLPTTMAQAHPHIFVSVEVSVVFEDDAPAAVNLAWIYDDYFSLLITADLGIDLDGDMVLTEDEKATLAASVTEWPADFKGDLEVMQGTDVIALAGRTDHTMTFENGIMREMHSRPIEALSDPDAPLTIRVYDPFYYVAYELVGDVTIEGRDDCKATVTPANLDAAYTMVEELLYGRPASDVGPDEEFPEVGVAFADTIEITCATSR